MFAHEGGYSEDYVPWCGLAVLDKMLCTGATATTVLLEDHTDPYLSEAKGWGYQGLQRNHVGSSCTLLVSTGHTLCFTI